MSENTLKDELSVKSSYSCSYHDDKRIGHIYLQGKFD